MGQPLPWECQTSRSCQARPEEAREPTSGTTLTMLGRDARKEHEERDGNRPLVKVGHLGAPVCAWLGIGVSSRHLVRRPNPNGTSERAAP